MNFKEMLEKDAAILINKDEFADEFIYKGEIVSGIFDEVADEIAEGSIYHFSIASSDIPTIAKNDIFMLKGIEYRVIDFETISGITDIILNKV